LASSDRNKKRSSGGRSAAARRSAGTTAGSRKASGSSSSTATKQPKGQKAAAKDGKSQSGGLSGRWSRARQRARSSGAARSAAGKEKGGLGKFLKDVRIELRKVTWPTRKDLFQSTIVVIVAVAIAGAYTGALDFIFSRIVDFIQGLIT
jgi:preprotein translocase subunit SecE